MIHEHSAQVIDDLIDAICAARVAPEWAIVMDYICVQNGSSKKSSQTVPCCVSLLCRGWIFTDSSAVRNDKVANQIEDGTHLLQLLLIWRVVVNLELLRDVPTKQSTHTSLNSLATKKKSCAEHGRLESGHFDDGNYADA